MATQKIVAIITLAVMLVGAVIAVLVLYEIYKLRYGHLS